MNSMSAERIYKQVRQLIGDLINHRLTPMEYERKRLLLEEKYERQRQGIEEKVEIDITKDRKSSTWIITKTDSEGFHHQLNLTTQEMDELTDKWREIKTYEDR